MEINLNHFQYIKMVLHGLQLLFIFVGWILLIGVFRSSAKSDGRPLWSFALGFLTLPALIFETMTVRFPRTRKFANPYALAVVDGLYMIFWLSAFAALASFKSSGKCGDGCHKTGSAIAMGVFVWLLFILTTAMSVYGVTYYNREGYLPGTSRAPTNAQMIDPDKEAFSTAPNDDYAPVHDDEEHEIQNYPVAGSSQLGEERYDNPAPTYAPSYNGAYVPPTAEDEGAYRPYYGSPQPGERVQFPKGSYN